MLGAETGASVDGCSTLPTAGGTPDTSPGFSVTLLAAPSCRGSERAPSYRRLSNPVDGFLDTLVGVSNRTIIVSKSIHHINQISPHAVTRTNFSPLEATHRSRRLFVLVWDIKHRRPRWSCIPCAPRGSLNRRLLLGP